MYKLTKIANNVKTTLGTVDSLDKAINTIALDINAIAGEDVYAAFDEDFAMLGLEEEINIKGEDTLIIDENLKYLINKI